MLVYILHLKILAGRSHSVFNTGCTGPEKEVWSPNKEQVPDRIFILFPREAKAG